MRRLLLQVDIDDSIGRRHDSAVLNEISKVRIFFFADGGLKRDWFLRDFEYLADLRYGNVHPLRDFLRRRLTAQFLHQLTRGADELVDGLDHMHRDSYGSRLIGNGASDCLANPPGCIRRKLVAAAVLE